MPAEKKTKTTPKDFFLYFGSIIALYASAVSLLNLVFDVINVKFPDILDMSYDPFSSSIRLAIATLIILFPAYLALVSIVRKDIHANPEKKNLGVRKWLTYLTLFVAGVVAVTDLIVLINTFLGGEITLRFILKVLAVLVVAKWAFIYYLYDLKDKWINKRTMLKALIGTVSLFVIASIIYAFVVIGSPKTQRLMRIDNQKISDLQNIQWQIVNYWQQKQKLPATLLDLNDPLSGFVVPHDPEGKAYEYESSSKLSFDLCADFNLANNNAQAAAYPKSAPARIGDQNENWTHNAGRTCFMRTIDPEKYPPFQKQ